MPPYAADRSDGGDDCITTATSKASVSQMWEEDAAVALRERRSLAARLYSWHHRRCPSDGSERTATTLIRWLAEQPPSNTMLDRRQRSCSVIRHHTQSAGSRATASLPSGSWSFLAGFIIESDSSSDVTHWQCIVTVRPWSYVPPGRAPVIASWLASVHVAVTTDQIYRLTAGRITELKLNLITCDNQQNVILST